MLGSGEGGWLAYLDELPRNADWTKQTLDLRLATGDATHPFRRVANFEDVHEWLLEKGLTPEEFKSMPVFLNALRKQPWLRGL